MPSYHVSRVGTKLGPRIAMLVSQAIVWTHVKLHSVKHKLAMSVFHAISDEISDEVDITLGPILQRLHDQLDESHPAYPSVHFMHTVSGQLKAIAGTGLQVSGLLGSVSTIMNNELADFVYNIVKSNPALLPDVGTISQSFAAGLVSLPEATSALASQGIQYGWVERMLALSHVYPSVSDAIELIRRGQANSQDFQQWGAFNGIPTDVLDKLISLINVPVSVADAALAVLRGNITQAEGDAIAAENGYDQAAFTILINNTGEPPGLEQLLEAYRREFIDKATLEKGIRDSRYRNEWIPMLEQLRYSPMSTSDAVNAANQNQMPADQARKVADQNGLTPGAFDTLLATAGEPLSRTEMEQLFNRGLVTQTEVEQALRESRLKNKYVKYAFDLHARLLTPSDVQRALRFGSVSEADAVKSIMMLGYDEKDATTLATAGQAERLQVFKDRVVSSVQLLIEAGIMSEATATPIIVSMGYPASDAKFIYQSSIYHRQATLTRSAINAVRSKYIGHHISRTEASSALDSLTVPADNRDFLLKQWDIDLAANTRVLTEAQVVKAVKKELITSDDGLARLLAMGYSQGDAELLIEEI